MSLQTVICRAPIFTSQELLWLPLVGYESDMSRLNELRLSGFIDAYAAAADLMMQQDCQIERTVILPSVLFSTRFITRYQRNYVWKDMAVVCRYASTRDLKPITYVSAISWALPSQREWSWHKHGVTEWLWRWLLTWGLEHPRTLSCDGMEIATIWLPSVWMCTCHLIYIGIVLVGHRLNLWRNHTTVLIRGKRVPIRNGYVYQLPNHTSTRCPSWSSDLIYDIVWVWPDWYRKRNALIPHQHEHENHWDSWQSLPCVLEVRLALPCIHTCKNVSRKAHCHQNHGNEIWGRMSNVPTRFYREVTLFQQ
jgi:hypothetical protein